MGANGGTRSGQTAAGPAPLLADCQSLSHSPTPFQHLSWLCPAAAPPPPGWHGIRHRHRLCALGNLVPGPRHHRHRCAGRLKAAGTRQEAAHWEGAPRPPPGRPCCARHMICVGGPAPPIPPQKISRVPACCLHASMSPYSPTTSLLGCRLLAVYDNRCNNFTVVKGSVVIALPYPKGGEAHAVDARLPEATCPIPPGSWADWPRSHSLAPPVFEHRGEGIPSPLPHFQLHPFDIICCSVETLAPVHNAAEL